MFFIKFVYKGEKIKLESNTRTGLYSEILDWLYKKGYEFKGDLHRAFVKKLLTHQEMIESRYTRNRFHKIDDNKYFYLYRNKDVQNFWKQMLENIGANNIEIKNESIQDSRIKKFGEIEEEDDNIDETEPMKNKKYSTLEAVQIILKKNDNNPMTANEIWNEINKIGLDINFLKHTMISRIGHFSINSGHSNKSDTPLFKVVSRSPIKYVLLNTESEIIETDDEVLDSPRVFVVRAGRSNLDAEIFLDEEFVGIGYDLTFNVSDKTKSEIEEFFIEKGVPKNQMYQYVHQIELFKEIEIGDIVLVPDSEGVNVGEVTSDNYFVDEKYQNRINVEWIDNVEKHSSVNIPKTVFELKNFDTNTMTFKLDSEESDIESDVESDEEFENKGSYSSEELVKKLKLLLVYGKDERNVTRLNETMRNAMKVFLQTLLSKNKTFKREEIKEELFKNGVGESLGSAGRTLSNLSQFITKKDSDFLRQIISYDSIRIGYESDSDVGARKDNYKIIDEYRELVSEVLDEIDVNINDKVLPFNKYVTSTHDIVPDYYTKFKQPQQDKKSSTSKYNWTLSSEVDSEEDDMRIAKEERDRITTTSREKNPFGGFEKSDGNGISAILVLGESGAGKSFTISKILKSEGHKFEFIIPTAATTGLLSQYSPSKKSYVPSRLSRMIIEAYKNPEKLYTAVFDECHKSNVIEMINDELLQAISKRRNIGDRFISLDDDTSNEVFEGEYIEKDGQGNIKIPDNLGFIFISSNPRVIGGNPDFFNRVDLVYLTEEDREKFNLSKDLLERSLKDRYEKVELIEKLRSM